MLINQPDVLKPIIHANLNQISRRDYFSPSSQNLMQLQTYIQTLKPSNGFQNMSQTPDVNYNSYQVHNVNDNLLRSQFNHQTPVMDPLKGLQSSFQGKKMNDNQYRIQISLQASDVNKTNGFINNYIVPNVSRHNGNWEGTQNTTLSVYSFGVVTINLFTCFNILSIFCACV